MTVAVGTGRSIWYNGDGAARSWAFPFRVLSASQIYLEVQDPAGVVSEVTAGFAVTGIGADQGAVEYPVAPTPALAAGYKVRVARRLPLAQPVRIGNQSDFHAQTHEDAFDSVVMLLQQIYENGTARGITAPFDDGLLDMHLPAKTARVGKLLEFDADGRPVTLFSRQALSDAFQEAVAATATLNAALEQANTKAQEAFNAAVSAGQALSQIQDITANLNTIVPTEFIAAAGQTVFTVPGGLAAGAAQVYYDGILQQPTVEYTTSGSAVTLTAPATQGAVVTVLVHRGFAVADALTQSGNLAEVPDKAAARANLGITVLPTLPVGQGQLTLSAGNAVYKPFRGSKVVIDGKVCTIPDAGVTLTAAGLTPGTTAYFIYARDADGDGIVDALEASTTGHSTQAGTGIEIKTGDATRTLVGGGLVGTGPVWSVIRSWANPQPHVLSKAFTADRSTTGTSAAELNTEIRAETFLWRGESLTVDVNGTVLHSNTSGGAIWSYIAIDAAVTPGDAAAIIEWSNASGGYRPIHLTEVRSDLAEGYHFATLLGKTNNGTATFKGGAAPDRTTLKIRTGG